jgi:hypothetical protein
MAAMIPTIINRETLAHEVQQEASFHNLLTQKKSNIQPWFAIVLQTILISVLIVCLAKPIYIANPGTMKNSDKTIYTVAITLAATFIAHYVASQIKGLWIAALHIRSPRAKEETSCSPPLASLLGVSSLSGSLRTPHIVAAFAIVALTTSAIVPALAPSTISSTWLRAPSRCNKLTDSGRCSKTRQFRQPQHESDPSKWRCLHYTR